MTATAGNGKMFVWTQALITNASRSEMMTLTEAAEFLAEFARQDGRPVCADKKHVDGHDVAVFRFNDWAITGQQVTVEGATVAELRAAWLSAH